MSIHEKSIHDNGYRSGADPQIQWADLASIAGVFAALSALYWFAVLAVSGRSGFSLDDAFIHLQFARHIFELGEMSFNAGAPSSGNTAPGFAALLALTYAVVRNWYVASYVLCAAASLATCFLVYAILLSWTGKRQLARWGGILTAVINPTVTQAWAGMESPVYSALVLLGLWCYGSRHRHALTLTAAIFALSIWFRPELLVLLPLLLLERLVHHWRTRREGGPWLRRTIADAVPVLAVWIVVLTTYVAYHWLQDGHLVPTTFGAKVLTHLFYTKPEWLDGLPSALKKGNWHYALPAAILWPLVSLLVTMIGFTTICLPLTTGLRGALAAHWRRQIAGRSLQAAHAARLASLLFLGYPILRGMVEPFAPLWFQQQRYFAHLSPLLVILVLGALPITGQLVRRGNRRWASLDLTQQAKRTAVWALGATLLMGMVAVQSVDNINDMQVEMAEWLAENTSQGDVIATNDIGAIGFLTGRHILDTVGLIEPPLVTHILEGGTVAEYLTAREPAYVVIFPNWYPELSQRRDLLQPAHSVRLALNVVCGGSELIAYRPTWVSP